MSFTLLKHFSFSSHDWSAPQGFAEYVELYSKSSNVRRGSENFRADVKAWQLDDILVFDRRVAGVVHANSRSGPLDERGNFAATLVLSGRVEGSIPTGRSSLQAGSIYLTDMQRPFRTEFFDAHVVTVKVSHVVIEAGLGARSALHGRVLSGPSSLLLADFFQSLARNSEVLTDLLCRGPCPAFVELLSGADEHSALAGVGLYRQDYRKRESVDRVIRAKLASRELSVGAISSETGMSRSALYRLFENHGGIARLITRRRLEAIRQTFEERRSDDLGTLASACGFLDERQMGRAFREAFGVSPNAYRALVAASPPGSPSDIRRRWQTWMSKIA